VSLLEDIDPLPVPPCDLGGCRVPRALLLAPGDQGVPEGRAPHRKTDESRHVGGGGEPGVDVRLVLTPAEDDAAHIGGPIPTRGLRDPEAILAAVKTLDLPDIRFDARLLQ
jgi:hypothetical protein